MVQLLELIVEAYPEAHAAGHRRRTLPIRICGSAPLVPPPLEAAQHVCAAYPGETEDDVAVRRWKAIIYMHSNGLDANLEGEPELESPSAELHPEESVEPLPYGRLRHVMSERLARERRAAERRLAAQRFDEDLGLEPECVAHPGCQDIEGSGDGVVDPGYECSCCA